MLVYHPELHTGDDKAGDPCDDKAERATVVRTNDVCENNRWHQSTIRLLTVNDDAKDGGRVWRVERIGMR
jgi:hypothetical protein